MRSTPLLLLCCMVLGLGGCATSATNEPASGDSDFTSERAADPGDVPAFHAGDGTTYLEYGGKMRVSLDGAAVTEGDAMASRNVSDDAARPSTVAGFAGASIRVDFGVKGMKPAVGTYSQADGEVEVMKVADENGHLTVHLAAGAVVIVDQIEPGPSPSYLRVYARFAAAANHDPGGLASAVKGTFVVVVPLHDTDR